MQRRKRASSAPKDEVAIVDDPKLDSCLKSLSKVKWTSLKNRFGSSAKKVPVIVREIVGDVDEATRTKAYQKLYADLYHSEASNATVEIGRFFIEFLECPSVKSKDKLMDWLERAVVLQKPFYALFPFDKSYYQYPFLSLSPILFFFKIEIAEEYFNFVEKACPLFLSFVQNDNAKEEEVLGAIALLSRFPKFREESLPVLEAIYNDLSKPVSRRASAVMALSHLRSHEASEVGPLKEKVMAIIEEKNGKKKEMNVLELSLFAGELFAYAVLIMDKKEEKRSFNSAIVHAFQNEVFNEYGMLVKDQNLPISVKESVLHFLNQDPSAPELQTSYGSVYFLSDFFINHFGVSFGNAILDSLSSASPVALPALVSTLLIVSFPLYQGRMVLRAPVPFDRFNMNDHQALVADSIAKCDNLWALPEKDLTPISQSLHSAFNTHKPPSKDSILLSLEKRREKGYKYDEKRLQYDMGICLPDENGQYIIPGNYMNSKYGDEYEN